MDKRVSSRGIIIEGEYIYLMFRRRITDGIAREYYVIPGGGLDEGETLEENLIREMKEELSVFVTINGYLGRDESSDTIAHFFSCSKEGTPSLGGEELLKNSEANYYEIKKVLISDINNIDVSGKEFITKAHNKEYEVLNEKRY